MTDTAKRGVLVLDGYAGRTYTPVDVIGETATKYRIRAITRTKLGGRARWIYVGEEALVPKSAIQLGEANAQ
jgi:hypothetical protein